jgi:ABC-type sugar transport system ATPase subunit
VVMREGRISGEFSRREATQESVMTAATGGTEQEVSDDE